MASTTSPRLQVAEDPEFQQREWKVQRAGWAVMAVLVALTSLGGFGRGVLSHQELRADGLTLEHHRVVRDQAPTELMVKLDGLAPGSPSTELWLDAQFVDRLEVRAITPEPVRTRAVDDRVVFTFDTQDAAHAEITFHVEPQGPGLRKGALGLVDGPTIGFRELVLP